jgi:hypothetical protein
MCYFPFCLAERMSNGEELREQMKGLDDGEK